LLSIHSHTWVNDHLRITTTWKQRPLFRGPDFNFHNIKLLLNNDHLSTTATNFESRGWSLCTGLTVVSKNGGVKKLHALFEWPLTLFAASVFALSLCFALSLLVVKIWCNLNWLLTAKWMSHLNCSNYTLSHNLFKLFSLSLTTSFRTRIAKINSLHLSPSLSLWPTHPHTHTHTHTRTHARVEQKFTSAEWNSYWTCFLFFLWQNKTKAIRSFICLLCFASRSNHGLLLLLLLLLVVMLMLSHWQSNSLPYIVSHAY